MSTATVTDFALGDMTARYETDPVSGAVALTLFPTALADRVVERRRHLDEREVLALPLPGCRARARRLDSLVQVQCAFDERPSGYAQGRTLRNGSTTLALRLANQIDEPAPGGGRRIITQMEGLRGLVCRHTLEWTTGAVALHSQTEIENRGDEPLPIELLSSFSLDGISPFHRADAPERLMLHRFRAGWSAEGRSESRTLESLQLERGWQGHSVAVERFGQVGTLPARGFFPWAGLEDTDAGVTWAAQLAWAGSWQIEVYRQGDTVALSGGLADREFGHWLKILAPGETLAAPSSFLTVCAGQRDDACARLVAEQERRLPAVPPAEEALAPIFNEFCSSWGDPEEARILDLADRLASTPVRYFVIDAGWYGNRGRPWSTAHGDWAAGNGRFPAGLAATAAALRRRGLIPGLWFEWETCGRESDTFEETALLLARDGRPITVADRRFLDVRLPVVRDRLRDRVIARLRKEGFGYVKFDYNETLGFGVDHPESPGEGLRQVIVATERLYAELARELPGVVLELCASGGHRLEPSLLRHVHMGSFSDAHETPELPIIAAGLHRLVPPRQLQVWAVLRAEAGPRRLLYVIAAGFLGRLCLSGDLPALDDTQWSFTRHALELYADAAPILREGRSHLFGPDISSWRHPHGWQLVLRVAIDGRRALVVGHTFAGDPPASLLAALPGEGRWVIADTLAEPGQTNPHVEDNVLHWQPPGAHAAVVVLLTLESHTSPQPGTTPCDKLS